MNRKSALAAALCASLAIACPPLVSAVTITGSVNNGTTEKVDTTFNQYAKETKLDTTSFLGGVAYNRHGCGTAGLSAVVAALNGAGLSLDNVLDGGVRVFPDPVVNKLSVYVTQASAGKVRLELWDLGGRPVLKKEVMAARGTTELGWDDVRQTGVVSGVYILRVVNDGGTVVRKVVVL